jgi:hypothetical protein
VGILGLYPFDGFDEFFASFKLKREEASLTHLKIQEIIMDALLDYHVVSY